MRITEELLNFKYVFYLKYNKTTSAFTKVLYLILIETNFILIVKHYDIHECDVLCC